MCAPISELPSITNTMTVTDPRFGEEFITSGELDLWGGQPGDMCTNPQVELRFTTGRVVYPYTLCRYLV